MAVTGVNQDPKLYGYQAGQFGGLTINPTRVAPAETGNQYGIAIPQNYGFTTGENGDKISVGQDGVGLAHKDPSEFKLHLIA